MFSLTDSISYYLYPYPTDMRKSFYTLGGIVKSRMGRDIHDGDAFIFVNKGLTSMKVLHAEYGGLVLYCLKLEKGVITLPEIRPDDPSTSMPVGWTDLMMMVRGMSPKEVRRHPRWDPKTGGKPAPE